MRTRLLIILAGIAAGPLVASAVSAEDPPSFDHLTFDAGRTSLTAERAAIDSDGDGWVDWYERFEGTDPNDANSYPGAAQLEIVDDRVVLQSTNFPDRFVIVDLATPEALKTPESALAALLGMVQDLRAGSGPGKALQTMISQFGKYGGTIPGLDGILSQAEQASGGGFDLGPRVGGIEMGLLSSVSVGFNKQGGLSVELVHLFDEDNTALTLTFDYLPKGPAVTEHGVLVWSPKEGGTTSVEWYKFNGTETSKVRRHWDGAGNLVWTQYLDANNKPIGPAIMGPGAPATTAAPATTEKAPVTSDSTPTSETTPTTVGDYADPEYQRPQLPSPEEIADRAEFLKGLSSRFGGTIDFSGGPKEKPVVADPAEPECRGAFCVVFTVVEAPDLSNVHGGDPINPDFAPEGPPITLR